MEMKEQHPAPEEPLSEGTRVVAQDETAEVEDSVEEGTLAETKELPVADLHAQLEAQRQQTQEYLDQLQRLQADFSNYRRRVVQEKSQAVSRGKEEVLLALLPILGNLRLALQHADQDANAVRQGVQMIWQQCEDFLRTQGVEPIATVGQTFDPAKHEALSTEPATDETPANTIVAEINVGYMLDGHLLRAAQVVVARAAEPEASPTSDEVPAQAEEPASPAEA